MKAAAQLVFFDDLAVGQELPSWTREAGRAQLFLFSAATWNPHRIHYDREYAASEGHPDVLVHGPLQGAWLVQYVTDWMGPRGRLLEVDWQNRGRAFPEQPCIFMGRVTTLDAAESTVTLSVSEWNAAGEILLPATAVVRLPRR